MWSYFHQNFIRRLNILEQRSMLHDYEYKLVFYYDNLGYKYYLAQYL